MAKPIEVCHFPNPLEVPKQLSGFCFLKTSNEQPENKSRHVKQELKTKQK